jgi:hypothetical protein
MSQNIRKCLKIFQNVSENRKYLEISQNISKVYGVDMAWTWELRDTGDYGFLLPADQIDPQWDEFQAGL